MTGVSIKLKEVIIDKDELTVTSLVEVERYNIEQYII